MNTKALLSLKCESSMTKWSDDITELFRENVLVETFQYYVGFGESRTCACKNVNGTFGL